MLLDYEKFYKDVADYYKRQDLEGMEAFLAEKEREIKLAVMPSSGCSCCCTEDVDEDGLTEVTRAWVQDRNDAAIAIFFEQGRLYQVLKRWEESLGKYEDVKERMERSNLTDNPMYETLLENMKAVKER